MNLIEQCIDQIIKENPEKYEDWTPLEIEIHKKKIQSSIESKIKQEKELTEEIVSKLFRRSL